MLDIKIDEMTLDDVQLLKDNLQSDFDDFWTIENLKSEINNPNSKYFIAKLQNKIVGFVGIWFAYDDVHLMNIVTHKNFRNQGVGKKLLEHIISNIKNKPLTLEVRSSNFPAIKLYEQFGFKKVGIRKNYYTHNNISEDALIMTKEF